jgi:hypothetical protein
MFHEQQLTISMRSNVREWTHVLLVNTPCSCLRNWREQRPSKQGYLDSNIKGEVGRVYYTGMELLLISFFYRSTRLFLGCILNGTSCSSVPTILQCRYTRSKNGKDVDRKNMSNVNNYLHTAHVWRWEFIHIQWIITSGSSNVCGRYLNTNDQ